MKRLLVITTLAFLLFVETNQTSAQPYQVPNSNFESWDGTSSTSEPVNWNSFPSANCALSGIYALGCSTAKSAHHYKVSGQRPGGLGSYYLTIWTKTVLTAKANGNITLGQIYIGSTTATSSSNYNHTKRSTTDHSQVFTSSPDSLYVWTKFWANSSTSQARISAFIHGNTDFKDPNDTGTATAYAAKATRQFTRTGTSAGNCSWVQQKIPFVNNGSSTRNYIIMTFTSNSIPGGGSAGDSLSIDDIELIYSAWLTDIKLNNVTLNGFQIDNFSYDTVFPRGTNPNIWPSITYTSEVSDVYVSIDTVKGVNNGIDSAKYIIHVLAEDSVTEKTYTINYSIWKSPDNTLSQLGYTLSGSDTVMIPGFTSSTYTYNVSLVPGTILTPLINHSPLSDTGARIIRIIQATTPNGQALITARAENGDTLVYTVNFSVELSNNANLDSLKYNGINVPDFHPDTLSYHIVLNPGTSVPPFVTAVTQWSGLTPQITQAAGLPGTATVKVTAEDGTIKTYSVSFTVALSTNSEASWIKYNGVALSNFHTDTLSYDIELPYGTTSVLITAAAVWPTAQVNIINPISLPSTGSVSIIAEDTNFKRTYQLNFTIEKNTNALLDSIYYTLNANPVHLNNFTDTVFEYHIVLAPKTIACPIIVATVQDINANVQITQVTSPNDTGFVKVTAEDGITEKTYSIVFSVMKDTIAYLSELKVNDSLIFDFNPYSLIYSIALDSAVMPVITANPMDTAADVNISMPFVLPGIVSIDVAAEDTSIHKTYKIYLSVKLSNNADLMDLGYTLNSTPYSISNFHKDTLDYFILLPSLTAYTPVITYQKADTASKVNIIQPSSPNDTAIITLTSASDTVFKTYRVFFEVEISTNANLSSLLYNNIQPANFHPDTTSYYIVLHYDSLTAPIVNAQAQSPAAHISIQQASGVNDTAIIYVLAEDSIHDKTYTIYFSRQLSPRTSLTSISYQLAGADSSIHNFSAQTFHYNVNLKEETVSVPNNFNYTLSDTRASIQTICTPQDVNDTLILKVTAENGIDTAIYTVVFNRLKSTDPRLDTIYVNGMALIDFHPDSLQYTFILPWGTQSNPVISATAAWDSSTVQITQTGTVFGQGQIRVIAEDGIQIKIYTIQFVQGSNVDLQSLSYNLGSTTYNINNFNPSDTIYHIMLPVATTDIPTLNYTLVDSRCDVDTVEATSPNGEISLIVKGLDSLNLKTYKVGFEVSLSTDARLAGITIDSVALPNFHPDTIVYTIEFAYGRIKMPLVEAIAMEQDAQIEINQITGFPATASIFVKAGDTNVSMTYYIHFKIEAGDNAYLADLNIDDTLVNGFNKNTLAYEYVLPYGSTVVPTITATPEDNRASVIVYQAASVHDTAFIEVTAVNGISTLTYQVIFSTAFNNNAKLADIKVDGVSIPDFDPNTRNYSYELPSSYQSIPVISVELQDSNAAYLITNAENIPGTSKIEVMAEDGLTSLTYNINFYLKSGIASISADNIKVYPNPANDYIYIKNTHKYIQIQQVQLFDLLGKQLLSQNVNESTHKLELSSLPKGIYMLKVSTHNTTIITMKIVKY